eukprot:CAMPEP_0113311006 /NCGR_PEP_ID=MMETSP0010_2-20120614/8423_1 /TAXON_ID=216773 ORGANISM="Corethron hystrix, Strain 308" /NCGR_SAMPLE_ID=MMETSP0010_2 /ASSEMBLY_ACC=CAM_ASM_000155 /LENGTH=62 /DNA_ID=CAMNT_0000166573 /DNA_START=1096 /DNA_END=1284 /DNA_ORIENTATION=+ /assembly_acc=CAM_ASM_000155
MAEDLKKGNIFTTFKEEMDSFVDNAINWRLRNGAQCYGKRKNSFYGIRTNRKEGSQRLRQQG